MRIGDWGTMLKFAKPHNGCDFSDGDDDQLFISPSHMTPSQAVGAGDAPQPTPIVLPDEAVGAAGVLLDPLMAACGEPAIAGEMEIELWSRRVG